METLNERQIHKKSHEHSARLKNPGKFTSFTTGEDKGGKGVNFIYGIRKDAGPEGGKTEIQAVRFDSKLWSVDDAKKWLSDHDKKYIKFTAATIKEDEAPAGPAITTSNMGATYAPKVLPMASRYGDYPADKYDQSFMKKMKQSLGESVISEGAIFKIGDKVKVSEGSGIASGKTATVVNRNEIKTDGRGVPSNVDGAYKPVDWSKEVAIKYSNGEYDTMFKNRLTKVGGMNAMKKSLGEAFSQEEIENDDPRLQGYKIFEIADGTYNVEQDDKVVANFDTKKQAGEFINSRLGKRIYKEAVVTEGKKKKFDIYYNGQYLSSSVTDKTAKQVKDDLIASIKSGAYKHPTYADPGTRKRFESIGKAIVEPSEFNVMLAEEDEPSINPDGTPVTADAQGKDLIIPRDMDSDLFDDYVKIYNATKPEDRETNEALAELAAAIIKKYFGEKKVQWGSDGVEVMDDQLIFKNFSSSEDTAPEGGEELTEGKFRRAKEEYNVPGTNVYVIGFGSDINGNSVIRVNTPNERARSLSVGDVFGGKTVRDDYWKDASDAKVFNKMLIDYIENHVKGMRLRKHGMDEGAYHAAMTSVSEGRGVFKEGDIVSDDEGGTKYRIYNISPNWAALKDVNTDEKTMVPIGDLYEFYQKVSKK